MSTLTPFQFRPMDQLTAEGRKVEMALRETGEVDTGWLFCGVPGVPRSFWTLGRRGSERIDPIGWRYPPTPEAIAAWKASNAAGGQQRRGGMTDDGLCHICRREPVRVSDRYTRTTCEDCDETAAAKRLTSSRAIDWPVLCAIVLALALGGGLAVLVKATRPARPAQIVIDIRCPAGEAAVCREMADAARAVALAKGWSAE